MSFSPSASPSSLLIGLGEADITPPFPHPLAGFGKARTACHEGVHDAIAARAAIFETDGEQVALVSCEVIGLRAEIIDQIRQAIPAAWNLPPERVVITCTHTHGAPVIEEPYVAFLIAQIIQALSVAQADKKPRLLEAGRSCHEEWVGFNRRNLETGFLPVDREVQYLLVREIDGRMRAILFHYACHPSILGPDNLLITADWPGYTRRALQKEFGEEVSVLYLKGTEGDINTGYSAGVSSLGIKIPTRTYETAGRVGKVIAATIVKNLGAAVSVGRPIIRFAVRKRHLNYRSTESLVDCREKLETRVVAVARAMEQNQPREILAARVEQAYAEFEVAAMEWIRATGATGKQVEQIAFCIGNAGFLSLPGEFFVESGLRIKREAKPAFTFPLGITGDYLGYIPPETGFPEGGYEVACARFTSSTAGNWCDSGIALLDGLSEIP